MSDAQKKDYGVLIAQKAERLATALYLVTDLIDNEEPLKGALRTNSIVLLSSMNTLAQPEVKDRIKEYKLSLRSVTEILSLIHVAATSGIVSEMNGRLLTDGFRSLQLVLEKKQPLLTKEMLWVEDEEAFTHVPAFTEAITGTSYDAITPFSLRRPQREFNSSLSVREEEMKGNFVKDKGQEDIKRTFDAKDKDNVSEYLASRERQSVVRNQTVPRVSSFQSRKQSRRDQILALFVRGVDVSIKDIATRIKGCSEKTIQRELNNLVFDKVIERLGEKRWSRYVLR